MDKTEVAKAFLLFCGEEGAEVTYEGLLDQGIETVKRNLKANADETETRLCYLAAAVAYRQYVNITAPRDKVACTFAGTIAENTDATQKLETAKLILECHYANCIDLLKEQDFVFVAVKG